MNQDGEGIDWELAVSDFIEKEEVRFKWEVLINAANSTCPIAISTIRLPATLYELMDSFERMRIINGDTKYTMKDMDGGLGYFSQLIMESDNIYELNYFSERLFAMDAWQLDYFEDLVEFR